MNTGRKLSVGDYIEKGIEKNHFITPTCHSQVQRLSITKTMRRRKMKISRKRLSFSPNINSFVMQSPDCSPIAGENCDLNDSTSPRGDFSPREMNQILKSEPENFWQNLSFLNKTISIENLLKSKNMNKYVDNFQNQEIDNLAVFSTLTERDLVEIGINNKKDRMIILEIVAEHGEI